MPRWVARLLWSMRGKRRVRLHLEVTAGTPGESVEGVLMGRWSGHYILIMPKVVQDEQSSLSLDGSLEVPAERVIFVQVLS